MKMSPQQLTTEIRNRLQLTTEVTSTLTADEKRKKKKKTASALKCQGAQNYKNWVVHGGGGIQVPNESSMGSLGC